LEDSKLAGVDYTHQGILGWGFVELVFEKPVEKGLVRTRL
jgi:hypothetical protein